MRDVAVGVAKLSTVDENQRRKRNVKELFEIDENISIGQVLTG